MADCAKQPAQGARARQQVQKGLRHQCAVGPARELTGGPEPEPPQSGRGGGLKQKAGQPQQEGQRVQTQQGAQRPQHVHGSGAVAQRAQGHGNAGHQGQHEQRRQHGLGAAAPAVHKRGEVLALRQQVGAGQDARRQIGVKLAHAPDRVRVVHRTPMRFTQADEFGQPMRAQGARGGGARRGIKSARGRGRHRVGRQRGRTAA
ncbi:hypothetical protein D3C87_1495380 [compost metagenome]